MSRAAALSRSALWLEAARDCRVVAGVLGLMYAGLSATPQAVDLLIALGQDGSPTAWLGLVTSTAWLAFNAWLWSAFSLRQSMQHGRIAAALPWMLAAVSLLAVADVLRTAAASIPPAMGSVGGGGRLLAATAMLLAASALLLLLASRAVARNGPEHGDRTAMPGVGWGALRMLALSIGTGVAGLAGFTVDPVRAASVLQPASIVMLAAAGLMCGGTLLLYAGRRTRVPLLFLAFALAAVLAALRDHGVLPDNHQLRRLPPGLRSRPDVESAFLRFLDCAGPSDGRPVQVVLVAASGGGIAAAYWTATVLGDLADSSPAFARQVFAMSGVSGGALGLTIYAAGSGSGQRATACQDPATGLRSCLQSALGGDFLGPTIGALLYPDLLQRFLPVPVFADRSTALESAWGARSRAVFGDERLAGPFLDLWTPQQPWPALLLNATSLRGGGRLVASNLALGADHVGGDGADLLALLGGDLPVSAAAGASARFPFISPLGTFRTADGAEDAVADGGYFENLGASTLLELLDALDGAARRHGRAVRFVVLQLISDPDNGSDTPQTPATPWSLLPRGVTGPATVLLRTREARGVSASESLARRVVALGGTYMPVRLGQSPIGRAAPLGWSLSAVARDIIDGQWTAACRDRVLAQAGLSQARAPEPPAVEEDANPMRMDVMAMWAQGTCRAVQAEVR